MANRSECTSASRRRFRSAKNRSMRPCRAVFLPDLVATPWCYADVVSFEGLTPHITLFASVGAVSASSPTVRSHAVLLLDETARCGSQANKILPSRLSPAKRDAGG